MEYDVEYVLCECPLDNLKAFVEEMESKHSVSVAKEPSVCLTMIQAEDTLEKQQFYLGEALTTECEVSVDGTLGIGLCLGEEPVRGYCIAFVDALMSRDSDNPDVLAFCDAQRAIVEKRDRDEFARAMNTRVDFKLMEED